LLARLKRDRGLAMLFITHDFNAARALADRIAVMDQGRLVEQGTAAQVLSRPEHPATRAMLAGNPLGRLPLSPDRDLLNNQPWQPS